VTSAGPVSRLQLGVGPLEIPGRQKVVGGLARRTRRYRPGV